jgi:hypothetical protein
VPDEPEDGADGGQVSRRPPREGKKVTFDRSFEYFARLVKTGAV